MIQEISKNNEAVFAELTKNTIVLCNEFGFRFMEKLFKPFENTQEGHADYLYNFKFKTDVVTIKNVSEKEFLVFSKNQTIRIILVNSLEDRKHLANFKHLSKDIWFAENEDVYALTEFRGYKHWLRWNTFLIGYFGGRFGGLEHMSLRD